MNFERPELLYLVLALLPVWLLQIWRNRSALERRRFPLFLTSIGLILFALANPYWRTVPSREIVKGVDLILAVDVSQSMFCINEGGSRRIDLANKFLKGLLPTFAGSQIAVVYFAGDAQVGSPFTTDQQAVSIFLDSIGPNMSAQPGTRTDSLEEALQQLLNTRMSEKLPLVLLFSDGEFFDSGRNLTSFLRKRSLRMFTYLCGSGKSPVPNFDLKASVPHAFSQSDAGRLQKLAEASQGAYFDLTRERADSVSSGIHSRVQEIIVEGHSVPDYSPAPFLILSLMCLILYQWFPMQRKLQPAALLSLLVFTTGTLSMSEDRAQQVYREAIQSMKNKRYEEAIRMLRSLPSDFPQDTRDIAIGNAFLADGKREEAIRYYKGIVERNPFHEIARWNWEVALKQKSENRERPPREKEQPAPENIPEQTKALLQYVDQLEKEQMRESNRQNKLPEEFAW